GAMGAMRALGPPRLALIALIALIPLIASCGRRQQESRIVLAATTSLEDTGLLDMLAREFRQAHPEIELVPIAVGTGQAIELGRRGDADVLITHDSLSELELVRSGVARERRSLMHNDFIIAGPPQDPARAAGDDALRALRAIAAAHASFISRGDDSGTHRRELELWRQTGIDPRGSAWYIEAGLGQGDALLLAGQKRAYILSDRATYTRFAPRLDLAILTEGDARLINRYAVTVLAGERAQAAEVFANWVTSTDVQERIGKFGRAEYGESFFQPAAHGAVRHDTIPTGERS
ncbi:MAG: substrate-binding domain-containing protein, partial [Gemmatimonadota bacterium]